ncbi:MAG TPA: hypothetical protein VL947_00580, partial [Cytophagales bacterium]|nr:hypothetical protein [Cytophagales bacterium]
MRIKTLFLILICNLLSLTAQYQVEYLNRGLIAVRSGSNNFVSWRFLGTEADNVTFNLYRGSKKLNSTPLTITNYTD